MRRLLLVALVLLAACAQQEEIRIGASLPLTGGLAFIGVEELRGLEMAAEEIGDIRLIVEDNAGDPAVAASAVTKLASVDDVDAIFSSFTHLTAPVEGIAERGGKLFIYASTVRSFAQGNDLAFRDYFDAFDSGVAIADAVDKSGIAAVSLLLEQSDVCEEYERGFRSASSAQIVSREVFSPEEKDYRTLLLKSDAHSPDGLVVCGFRHAANLMAQMRELGMIGTRTFHLTAPFLPAADTQEIRMIFEENGAISTWYGYAEGNLTPAQHRFIERYVSAYGRAPRPDALYFYDDLHFLAEAMRICARKASCVSAYLEGNGYDGVAGPLRFDEDGISERDVLLITVRNGEWAQT